VLWYASFMPWIPGSRHPYWLGNRILLLEQEIYDRLPRQDIANRHYDVNSSCRKRRTEFATNWRGGAHRRKTTRAGNIVYRRHNFRATPQTSCIATRTHLLHEPRPVPGEYGRLRGAPYPGITSGCVQSCLYVGYDLVRGRRAATAYQAQI